MRALKSVEGLDIMGQPYLMVRECGEEGEYFEDGADVVFMKVVVGCIIFFGAGVEKIDLDYYGKAVVLLSVGFGEKCDRWG